MIFYKLRKMLRTNSMKPNKFVWLISIVLIVLAWPLPLLIHDSQQKLFDIPLMYFYIILVAPALILLVTNWAVKFADNLDRQQLETEND